LLLRHDIIILRYLYRHIMISIKLRYRFRLDKQSGLFAIIIVPDRSDSIEGELGASSRNFLFTEFPGGNDSLSGNRLPSDDH